MAIKGERSEQDRQQISLSLPAPDINLPLSADISTPPPSWSSDSYEILDLSPHTNDADATVLHLPKLSSRKCAKRVDSIWGGWFFFNYYFKPLLSEKSKAKITHDENGFSGFDKSDLKLDVFLVQHDMENMYMWVFKERPENALGKMQLRSYMNGHSRLGESQFPFSVEKGFVRSHRMQRKHYKGLSNPQCIHGIEFTSLPDLSGVSDDDRKKWMELTGRDVDVPIPPEASDFGAWRNGHGTEFELDRPLPILKGHANGSSRRFLNGSALNLDEVVDVFPHCNKRGKGSPPHAMEEDCCFPVNSCPGGSHDMEIYSPDNASWINDFSGVMRRACGPVTGAKTIYEDDMGYLVMVSLPFSDRHRLKVCWRNEITHGVVKIFCVSTGRMDCIKRHDRTFRLTDPSPEHCPPGEFVREISLPARIHEDAKIEAYYDETGTILEIMVPKHAPETEEHEVHVSMCPPHLGTNDLMLN
ncbi:hypothetical protein KSP40_PGU002055 [Platanthera guangdongensis]|uniref:HSP20-like chaperones superfamily protein n=1 Tax=Platanthera guangdongensis TaxID=2320717 RepID=A0ABR2M6Q5_9ASPA